MLLDCRGEIQQVHDLRDSSAGDAFAAGDGGLGGDLASAELATPFYGLAKRLDDSPGGRRVWVALEGECCKETAAPR